MPATEEARPRIGYVGLGHAGERMAGSLARAGYELVVRDRDGDREQRFAREHGCRVAATPDDFAGVELLITMLPNGDVVRDVLLEADRGIARRLFPGSLVVDTSSSDPAGTRRLGAELAELGLVLLDAPVSRPEPGRGNDRRLTIMVGGDDGAAVERALPVLSAMSERVVPVGPLGCGHALKTLNNYVSAAGLVAALDALVVGYRFGLDPRRMLEVINASTGRNFSTAFRLKEEALTRRFGSGYGLALLVKDIGIAEGLVEGEGLETSLPGLLRAQLEQALAALGPDADHTAALRHWEARAGLELPASPDPELAAAPVDGGGEAAR